MKVRFLDLQDADNRRNNTLVEGPQELVDLLEQLRVRKPFGFELVSDNGSILTVSLAETFGAVEYTTNEPAPAFLLAMKTPSPPLKPALGISNPHSLAFGEDEKAGVESPEFLVGGTPTPIPTRYILPYDLLAKIAVHFLRTGDRAPEVSWELI